jgi:hypothetical protein
MTTIRRVFSPYVTSGGMAGENSVDARAGGRKRVHTTFYTRIEAGLNISPRASSSIGT